MKMYVDCSNTSHIEYLLSIIIIMIMIVVFIIICKKVHVLYLIRSRMAP